MKRKLLFAICVLTIYFSQGQYVPIDTAFEDVLIAQGIDSEGISDSRILLSDALSTTSLNLSGSTPLVNNPPGLGLFNINGIEFFTNLETLRIEGNNITNLDLTQNTFIRELRAWNNDMETLIVTGLNNLQTVGLNFNSLTNVDFSTNGAIQELDITDNNLTTISMGNKVNLGKFTLSNNPNLNSLNISGVDGNLLTFDTRGNTNLSCIEVSSITNANSQAGWQKEPSTSYSENCGQNYTQIPDPAFENYLITQGIDSQGIANGRVLTADIQNVLNLDIQNLGITNLSGIEDFTALQTLNVNNNSISTVDLSANVALTSLSIQSNLLSSVNVTQNINLITLNIAENSINTIDLSQNTLLEIFTAYLCNLQTLDLSTNVNLEELTIYRNSLTALDVTSNTNLKYINAEFMNLGSIDVSQNPVLEFLLLSSTGLAAIDTSNNPLLTALLLGFNSLTTLDISNLPNLNSLYVNDNNLTAINVRQNPLLNIFDAQNNSGLSCIEVIDVNTAENQFNWRKDTTTVYSENCNGLNYTLIPDLPFENYLITQGVDSQGIADGRVLTADIQIVLSLDMQSLGITNLSGIEDFTALQTLNVNNNSISTVDLSANVALTSLSIQNNNLGALDVTQNINLTNLNIGANSDLSTINLSQNSELVLFSAYGCNLQTIDVSLNTNLEELYLSNNQLTNIDLSQNNNLTRINLSNNTLTQLDLSNLPINQIYSVYTCDTGLSCISVSDATAANSSRVACPPLPNEFTGFIVDSTTEFSEDCGAPSPFQVSVNLNNNTSATDIEIIEGNTFTINFSATNTPPGSVSYNPIIALSLNGASANDDFIYNGSTTVPNAPFNVNINGTTGSITIEANDEGIPEEDENYTLTVSSPDTSVFVMEEPTVFNITVSDKSETRIVRAFLTNAGSEGNYSVIEGNTFKLNFETLGLEDVNEFVRADIFLDASTAIPDFGFNENSDFKMESTFVSFQPSGLTPDEELSITAYLDEQNNEEDDIVIKILKPFGNYEWENAAEDGSIEFIVRIEEKPVDYPNAPISISLEGQTNATYSITEGETLLFSINGTNPTFDGQTYPIYYTLDTGTTTFSDIDFISSDRSPLYVDLSAQNPDETIEIEIRDDQINNEGETFIITFLPNGNYTFENADIDGTISFEVKVEDKQTNSDLEANVEVRALLRDGETTPITGTSPFRLSEGQIMDLSFDLENLLATTTGSYGIKIETINGTARHEDGDFQKLDRILTINTNDEFIDDITFNLLHILNDGSLNEQDENFFIEITPLTTNNLRLVDFISNENGQLLAQNESLRFEIIIENGQEYGGEPFKFSITPRGDVTGNEANNNLQIYEGQILELWVDAETPNNAEGFSFQLEPLFDSKFNEDIEIIENNPIVVDNSKNPDGIIKIRIKEDAVVDEDELVNIIFRNYSGDFSFTNLYNFNGDSFRNIPITLKNSAQQEFFLTWDNRGSLEGGSNEEITIFLKDKNGNPYTIETNLEFSISFDTNIESGNPAEPGEYPENQTITINSGSSTATLRYPVPMDITEDNEAEFYRASITANQNNNIGIDMPNPLLIKILDDKNLFTIFAQPFTKQTTDNKYYTPQTRYSDLSGCCDRYTVQEGSNYVIGFEAEKGVPIGQQNSFTVEVSYLYAERGTSGDLAPQAENLIDFENVDEDNIASYYPKLVDNPDNRLIIQIFDDEFEASLGNTSLEGTEKFQLDVQLDELSAQKFVLQSVAIPNPGAFEGEPGFNSTMNLPFTNTDIFIEQVEPISLEVVDSEINEENFNTDFARIRIKRLNNSSTVINEVNLIIYNDIPGTDATENLDYEPIAKSISLGSEIEQEIIIRALNDDIVEGREQIRIGIAPGNGYSFSNENIAVITITDEDLGDFDASISITNANKNLYEDETLGPTTGFFEIDLSADNQTEFANEDILINFTIISGEGQATLGDDYKIFDGNGANKREITNDAIKYLTVKEGESKGFITIEVVQNDELIESPETVGIKLTTGIGYNLINSAESLSIISKEENTSELDPGDIAVQVTSATCPGSDEGEVSISNSSPFDFVVNIFNANNLNEKIEENTLLRNTLQPKVLFENLKAGDYIVKLTLEGNLKILPPSFKITIRENLSSTGLLSSTIEESSKMVNLTVTGSTFYEIESNGEFFEYQFESSGANNIKLPISYGNNKIIIRGEASCQGKVEKEFFLPDVQYYPNPTKAKIHFIGLIPKDEIEFYLYDSTGRTIIKHLEKIDDLGGFNLNIESLSKGTYFGEIISKQQGLLKITLIKN